MQYMYMYIYIYVCVYFINIYIYIQFIFIYPMYIYIYKKYNQAQYRLDASWQPRLLELLLLLCHQICSSLVLGPSSAPVAPHGKWRPQADGKKWNFGNLMKSAESTHVHSSFDIFTVFFHHVHLLCLWDSELVDRVDRACAFHLILSGLEVLELLAYTTEHFWIVCWGIPQRCEATGMFFQSYHHPILSPMWFLFKSPKRTLRFFTVLPSRNHNQSLVPWNFSRNPPRYRQSRLLALLGLLPLHLALAFRLADLTLVGLLLALHLQLPGRLGMWQTSIA